MSWQWRMMQNLKRNWIVGSKLTWGIWRILTRTLENLKNLPFNRLLLTKAVSKWKQHGFFDQRIYIEKSTWKKRGYYDQGNYVYKSTWKLRRFVNQRNYTEKNMWKQCRFFEHRNYVEKSTWKRPWFFDQQNYIEKIRENNVEICRNLVFDVLTLYPRPIDVDSTWWARWEVRGLQFSFNTYG